MTTEQQKPKPLEITPSSANRKLAELRINVYRAIKAIAISIVLIYAYNWLIHNTEIGKKFRFSSEFLISLGSGVAIALWQYANDKQKQKLEASKNVQEENRQLINANHEKVSGAIGVLERRIDSALLQITQQQTDFGEVLITINQIEAEIEQQEDTIADNRHEALNQDLKVYHELTAVKVELAYIQGLLQIPIIKNPPKLPPGG